MTDKTTIDEPTTNEAVNVAEQTDTIESTSAPEETLEAAETTVAEPAEEVEEVPSGNREAAKYRRQAREAEAERDTLTIALQAARQTVIEGVVDKLRVKSSQQLHPNAISDAIPDPSAFFGSDGKVNNAALMKALIELQESKPHFFRTNYDGTFIIAGEGRTPVGEHNDGESWEKAFKPKD